MSKAGEGTAKGLWHSVGRGPSYGHSGLVNVPQAHLALGPQFAVSGLEVCMEIHCCCVWSELMQNSELWPGSKTQPDLRITGYDPQQKTGANDKVCRSDGKYVPDWESCQGCLKIHYVQQGCFQEELNRICDTMQGVS